MTRDDGPGRAEEIIHRARNTRAWTAEMRARMIEAAREVAATEEQVAGTFERLAEARPHRARWLAELSASARKNAAYQLQWAEDQAAGDRSAGGSPTLAG